MRSLRKAFVFRMVAFLACSSTKAQSPLLVAMSTTTVGTITTVSLLVNAMVEKWCTPCVVLVANDTTDEKAVKQPVGPKIRQHDKRKQLTYDLTLVDESQWHLEFAEDPSQNHQAGHRPNDGERGTQKGYDTRGGPRGGDDIRPLSDQCQFDHVEWRT